MDGECIVRSEYVMVMVTIMVPSCIKGHVDSPKCGRSGNLFTVSEGPSKTTGTACVLGVVLFHKVDVVVVISRTRTMSLGLIRRGESAKFPPL